MPEFNYLGFARLYLVEGSLSLETNLMNSKVRVRVWLVYRVNPVRVQPHYYVCQITVFILSAFVQLKFKVPAGTNGTVDAHLKH